MRIRHGAVGDPRSPKGKLMPEQKQTIAFELRWKTPSLWDATNQLALHYRPPCLRAPRSRYRH